ncbi:MAG: hypothetical protein OEY85_11630, partial [Rhodospirillales bacterium]|nr:hypothetical protein [Rhodospirillales bacterium]
EKARVGARLALVHILNRKYDKALEILDLSETDGMSETLITQRRHLRARALFGVDQGNNALTLLTKDESLEADLLRAEIYWQDRNWPEAAKVLQRLVRSTNAQPGGSLNDKQSRFILNLATALTLSGNERLLNRLRNNFGESMEAGPYKDAFRLIATPQTEGLIDYRTIADRVSVVESFQTFMNSYQDRLKSKKLSAIN